MFMFGYLGGEWSKFWKNGYVIFLTKTIRNRAGKMPNNIKKETICLVGNDMIHLSSGDEEEKNIIPDDQTCDICNKTISNKKSMLQHQSASHFEKPNEEIFQCNKCFKNFAKGWYLCKELYSRRKRKFLWFEVIKISVFYRQWISQ